MYAPATKCIPPAKSVYSWKKVYPLARKVCPLARKMYPPWKKSVPPCKKKVCPLQEKCTPLQERNVYTPCKKNVSPLEEKCTPLQEKGMPPQEKCTPLQQKGARKVYPLARKVYPLARKVYTPLQEFVCLYNYDTNLPPYVEGFLFCRSWSYPLSPAGVVKAGHVSTEQDRIAWGKIDPDLYCTFEMRVSLVQLSMAARE